MADHARGDEAAEAAERVHAEVRDPHLGRKFRLVADQEDAEQRHQHQHARGAR